MYAQFSQKKILDELFYLILTNSKIKYHYLNFTDWEKDKWSLNNLLMIKQRLNWEPRWFDSRTLCYVKGLQIISSVQFNRSVVSDSATPWTAACQASMSITNSRTLLKLMPIESVMPSNYLILGCPLLFLPSIPPSIRVFSNESVLHIRRPKYWSFSFSISPSKEYSGLISFRMDWLNLLVVQGTLKSLLQHYSSKA